MNLAAITIIRVNLDPGVVAAVNGTVLTIYEVVLAAFLSQSVIASSELIAAAEDVWQVLCDYPLEFFVTYLQRKPWNEYETRADEGRAGLHFDRAGELVRGPASEVSSEKGEEYICTIMAIAAQYPYPKKVRSVAAGGFEHVELNRTTQGWVDGPPKSGLDSGKAIEEWTRLIGTISRWLAAVLPKSYNRGDALLEAADHAQPGSARFGIRKNFEAVVEYMDDARKLARDLRSQYEHWRARRPGPWARRALAAGFMGGGVMFVLGVLVPMIRPSAPYFVYSYIPAAWYFCVLLTITWVGVRRSIRA